MATRRKRAQREPTRADLKKLRDLGLTGKAKIDLRKKPGRRERNLIKKFSDVLSGRAQVVEVATEKKARGYAGRGMKRVGKNVIVPTFKGEKVRINKKTGEIETKRRVNGKTVTKIVTPKDARDLEIPKGMKPVYSVPFKHGDKAIRWQRFDNFADLEAFMGDYDERYPHWRAQVSVEYVSTRSRAKQVIEPLGKAKTRAKKAKGKAKGRGRSR